MRRLRFYCESIESRCVLDEEQSHHLSRVLRISPGTTVEVFDGKGALGSGRVQTIERRQAIVEIDQVTRVAPATSGRTILAVSYAKGQRFDWLVEKCTELGASHIAAIQFERTVKLGGEHAMERLRRISLSASKQCGRLFLPEITGPDNLQPGLRALIQQYPKAVLLCGDPNGRPPESINKLKDSDVLVLVGPEGGFSREESQFVAGSNLEPVSINSNILRVETAAVAFCAYFGAPVPQA